MFSASERKELVRRLARLLVRDIPATESAQFSERLLTRLRQHPQWTNARSVLLFAPLNDEPDIWPLIAEGLADGKIISLPRFDSVTGFYRAARITALSDISPPGAFGVREPARRCAEVPLKQLDLALVPGVAFDPFGRRLGRGKGFYDRLLAEVAGVKCGVAFDCQVLAELPREPHDVTLNCLVTPTRWLEFPPGAQV